MKAFVLGRYFSKQNKTKQQTFNVQAKEWSQLHSLCRKKNLFSNVQGKLHFTFMLNFPCLWVNDGNVAYGS